MTIATEISIEAPAEKVWAVLIDFDNYPNWNPFITNISGTPKKGAVLGIQIGTMRFRPQVLECNSPKTLKWLGSLWFKGIFDGEHLFEIRPEGPEKTTFRQVETFSGLTVPLFKRKLQHDTKNGFIAMNKALKLQCEEQQFS
ncbi:SRPBCC family protein [Maribacter sp. 2-571]|uniref:SRPBCC family protein n=1 Tax=Maribacter sp. 2-571 TaxID=3417569 RepID=UPI003D328FFD